MKNRNIEIQQEVSSDKIELAKPNVKSKTRIWFTYLLFGWSYGSLGNLGAQILWYLIPSLAGIGLYQNFMQNQFTVLTSVALVLLPGWIIWNVVRIFTLNRAIEKYNQGIADIFGLNREERELLDL